MEASLPNKVSDLYPKDPQKTEVEETQQEEVKFCLHGAETSWYPGMEGQGGGSWQLLHQGQCRVLLCYPWTITGYISLAPSRQ